MSTDAGVLLHQKYLIPSISNVQSCLNPGYSSPNYQSLLSNWKFNRKERLGQAELLNEVLDNLDYLIVSNSSIDSLSKVNDLKLVGG